LEVNAFVFLRQAEAAPAKIVQKMGLAVLQTKKLV
jgi:hypothetical protein